MRCIIQRVIQASVIINQEVYSSIHTGLLVLLGIEDQDYQEDIDWLCNKLINLRIFNDADGKMNISVKEKSGEFLVISQFTLYANSHKGNRPSYTKASKPDIAQPLYELFVKTLAVTSGLPVFTGIFGADMKVQLINDGPVTIFIDTKNNF